MQVESVLVNTGHDLRVIFEEQGPYFINLTGGPTSYQYRLTEVILHFGSTDMVGSEHTIAGRAFAAEVNYLVKTLIFCINVNNVNILLTFK